MQREITDPEVVGRTCRQFRLDCPSCDASLADLVGTGCPRCGQPLVLKVGLAEPRTGVFVTGLVFLGASLGFSVVLLVYFEIYSRYQAGRAPPRAGLWLGMLAAIGLAGLSGWLVLRKSIWRSRSVWPWLLVAGAVVYSLCSPVVFFLLIR